MNSAVAVDELRIEVGAATDAAGRDDNEDAVLVTELSPTGVGPAAAEGGLLLAVADGMGGHEGGEVASRLAVDTVRELVVGDGADMGQLLKQAFRRANQAIYERAQSDGGAGGMGTTLVVAVTRGKYATIANVGDSRAYLVRANRLTQITEDHSLVAEQVSKGAMTRAEARESPQRNILTQALGQRPKLESKLPSIYEIVLLAEDRLLLCSDGCYDVVEDDDIAGVLLGHEPETAARRLVDLAIERGARDNVSTVVAQVMPVRARVEREVVAAAPTGPGAFLVPALVLLAVVLFIAIVLFVLIGI